MIQIKTVSSDKEWQAARRIRQRVFVEEQNCPPKEEWDEHDDTARHMLVLLDDEAIGTARWRATRFQEKPVAKLERFAIEREMRGRGFGRKLVQRVIRDAEQAGFATQYIHAQTYLKSFYEDFGFEKRGEPFDEAGIQHIRMVRHSEDQPKTKRDAA